MKKFDRIFVYIVGFILGSLLVSMIMKRRALKEEASVDPWVTHNAAAVEAGAEGLPVGLPEVIQIGKILDFGYLPNEEEAHSRVWHLNFAESYPYVRVVEDLSTGEFSYMAADQILIELADGVDVTALKPMLDELGLRLRMFNRKDQIAVVGVLSTQIDAVPVTIEALQPYSELFQSVGPDVIEFK
ncbi:MULTISPECIES: hypothetical protein [unclassified Lentimonas]|uniref:hypothetical protein n=1 Tax=unclassified Lentimonas TaxID=2630993 RepID=UPI0013264CC4|nr:MULTISPECIES: hypothetical protein [unclassified Lentimonas]CAA6693732.1 Unannotated [Lentimonas sp. CC10]CAA6696388.1 Unannotated [Lentimonas sp. CC19]CAA7071639.1 Unannotated [Lentimonas sp. CC11]